MSESDERARHPVFAAVACLPEERIDLARASLAIAQAEYPDLDVDRYLQKIDKLAQEVRDRAGQRADTLRLVATLNYVLFTREGLRGNTADYYDPKNSFLNDVMDRKLGIPISLAVLYMQVAAGAGLALLGVGFPGHFLVKHLRPGSETIIDPFHRGAVLGPDELQERLNQIYGGRVVLGNGFLAPVSKKQILVRMLNNLKSIYLQSNDDERALSVVQRLVILDPASPENIRDRGLLHLKGECFM
jgi:regulator of sirC expression with transglutaminase-like and TPR domain